MPTELRLAFRATTADLTNLKTVATGLRATGNPFANRTDAVRHALAQAAAACTVGGAANAAAAVATAVSAAVSHVVRR